MTRQAHKKALWLLTPALVLSGCTLFETAPDDPVMVKLNDLEARMAKLERIVQNQSLVNLTQQVNTLERRDDVLEGKVDELQYESQSTADRQRQLYVDLDARIRELEAQAQARNTVNVLDGGTLQPGQLPVPGGSDRDNYQAAFELLKAQRYEPAAQAFEEFLVAFPDSELADNAQYWLAETQYVTQQFTEALGLFQTVVDKYPQSRKIPDALLKIGYCNYELKQFDAARLSLQQVQTEYPDTTAARLAGQRLARMDEENV